MPLTQKAHAQTYTLLEPIPGVAPIGADKKPYFSTVYTTILTLVVILSVIMIVVGGIQYSASSINPSLKSEAKSRISAALGGLLLAFFSWLILQTINPNILALPSFLQ